MCRARLDRRALLWRSGARKGSAAVVAEGCLVSEKVLFCISPFIAVVIGAHEAFATAQSSKQHRFKAIWALEHAHNSPFREVWP
jgi:hypothetical protein